MGIEYFVGLAKFASMCSDPDKVDPPPSHENESHEPADGGEAAARYEEGIQLPDCRGCQTNGREEHICGALNDKSIMRGDHE